MVNAENLIFLKYRMGNIIQLPGRRQIGAKGFLHHYSPPAPAVLGHSRRPQANNRRPVQTRRNCQIVEPVRHLRVKTFQLLEMQLQFPQAFLRIHIRHQIGNPRRKGIPFPIIRLKSAGRPHLPVDELPVLGGSHLRPRHSDNPQLPGDPPLGIQIAQRRHQLPPRQIPAGPENYQTGNAPRILQRSGHGGKIGGSSGQNHYSDLRTPCPPN